MTARPAPKRGDWYRSRGCWSAIELKSYWTPPSLGLANPLPAFPAIPIEPNTLIGPVHNVDYSNKFLAVQVPHPYHSENLVWINVWFFQRKRHNYPIIEYAYRISEWKKQQWLNMGWIDRYIGAPPPPEKEHNSKGEPSCAKKTGKRKPLHLCCSCETRLTEATVKQCSNIKCQHYCCHACLTFTGVRRLRVCPHCLHTIPIQVVPPQDPPPPVPGNDPPNDHGNGDGHASNDPWSGASGSGPQWEQWWFNHQ